MQPRWRSIIVRSILNWWTTQSNSLKRALIGRSAYKQFFVIGLSVDRTSRWCRSRPWVVSRSHWHCGLLKVRAAHVPSLCEVKTRVSSSSCGICILTEERNSWAIPICYGTHPLAPVVPRVFCRSWTFVQRFETSETWRRDPGPPLLWTDLRPWLFVMPESAQYLGHYEFCQLISYT